jgi:hypothetical protein
METARNKRHGITAVSIGAATVALVVILGGSSPAPVVGAQSTDKDSSYPVEIWPPLPGTKDSTVDSAAGAPVNQAAPPASPVPSQSTAAPAPPGDGNSMTTSLGGSDIAVSSVGGSYEVDGPARKRNRHARQSPTP